MQMSEPVSEPCLTLEKFGLGVAAWMPRGKRAGLRSFTAHQAAVNAAFESQLGHVRAFTFLVLRQLGLPSDVAARIVIEAHPDGRSRNQAITLD